MDRSYHMPLEAERARYEKHTDDVDDPGHRKFVTPLVEEVITGMPQGSRGLDFGSGRGAIVSTMLAERGMVMERYDPFFYPDHSVLNESYDFIAACEVAEHFREPRREFGLLRSILRDGGKLFVMTHLIGTGIDFSTWYYKDDETHVFFYSKESFEWVRSNLGFRDLTVNGRVIVLVS